MEYRKALDMDPGYPWAMRQLGGRIDEHGPLCRVDSGATKSGRARPRAPSALAALGRAYVLAGRRREAERRCSTQKSLALSRRRYVPPHCFVSIYWGFGIVRRDSSGSKNPIRNAPNSLLWLGILPDTDWLRSDPRLENLLRRIGLK